MKFGVAATVLLAELCLRRCDALSLPTVSAWAKSVPKISATEIRYLEEVTTLPQLLAVYHASAAAQQAQDSSSASSLLVAPNLQGVTAELASDVSAMLSADDLFQGLYGPSLEQDFWGPSVSLHHSATPSDAWRAEASPDGALSDSAAMDKVFLWLQQQLLGFNDEAEGEFITLGRKLLSVGRHVVTGAATEGELCAVFWEQASAMQRDAAQGGVPSADDDEESSASVLLAAPAMAQHPDFASFFRQCLGQPLERISTVEVAGGGSPLVAEAWVGGGLEFPVILLSPPLPDIEEPEGGYKVYTTKDGEVNVDDYIAAMEAEEAAVTAEANVEDNNNFNYGFSSDKVRLSNPGAWGVEP